MKEIKAELESVILHLDQTTPDTKVECQKTLTKHHSRTTTTQIKECCSFDEQFLILRPEIRLQLLDEQQTTDSYLKEVTIGGFVDFEFYREKFVYEGALDFANLSSVQEGEILEVRNEVPLIHSSRFLASKEASENRLVVLPTASMGVVDLNRGKERESEVSFLKAEETTLQDQFAFLGAGLDSVRCYPSEKTLAIISVGLHDVCQGVRNNPYEAKIKHLETTSETGACFPFMSRGLSRYTGIRAPLCSGAGFYNERLKDLQEQERLADEHQKKAIKVLIRENETKRSIVFNDKKPVLLPLVHELTVISIADKIAINRSNIVDLLFLRDLTEEGKGFTSEQKPVLWVVNLMQHIVKHFEDQIKIEAKIKALCNSLAETIMPGVQDMKKAIEELLIKQFSYVIKLGVTVSVKSFNDACNAKQGYRILSNKKSFDITHSHGMIITESLKNLLQFLNDSRLIEGQAPSVVHKSNVDTLKLHIRMIACEILNSVSFFRANPDGFVAEDIVYIFKGNTPLGLKELNQSLYGVFIRSCNNTNVVADVHTLGQILVADALNFSINLWKKFIDSIAVELEDINK